jgi:hypothetical protein
MSCLDSDSRAWYEERLTKLQAQLEALDTAIDNGTLHVEMASLDTGEGKQVMKYKKFEDMFDAQKRLESRIRRYFHILKGSGTVNMNLRRKNNGGYYSGT